MIVFLARPRAAVSAARSLAAIAFIFALAAGPGPVLADGKTVGPAPSRTALTYYESGSARTLWLAQNELAVFLKGKSPSKSAAALAARSAGASAPLPGSDSSVLFIRSASPAVRGRTAASLHDTPGIKGLGRVFYTSSDAKTGRLTLDGGVIVHPRPGQNPTALIKVARRYGLVPATGFNFSKAMLFSSKGSLAGLRAANALQRSGLVRYASPNWTRMIVPASIPNDVLFGDQWHLRNDGQGGAVAGEDIDVTGAWSTVRGTGTVISIIDGGVEPTHPDLSPNLLLSRCFDFVDNDTDQTPGSDPANPWDLHGTAVAGVAAAKGFNGIGVTGVAPDASLISYRVDGTSSDATLAAALAMNLDVTDISSNSWGPEDGTLTGPSQILRDAIKSGTVTGRAGKGIVYVFAAGNGGDEDNSNANGLAAMRQTVAVSASDGNGERATYSEPGANILVNAPSSDGTSMQPCPATSALQNAYQAVLYLPELYRFRDDFLQRSGAGRHAIGVYYRNGHEIAGMIATNPTLRTQAMAVLDAWMPALRSLSAGDGKAAITPKQTALLRKFAAALSRNGSKRLRDDLTATIEGARLPGGTRRTTIGSVWGAYRASNSSNPVSSLHITPSSLLPGVTTTDRLGSMGYSTDDYTAEFGGTSASCPQVAGVSALMLQANPSLSWRDVQRLLADTADVNDPGNASWHLNGAGYVVSDAYGFGRANATRAVSTAHLWPLSPAETIVESSTAPRRAIPDANPAGVTSRIVLPSNLNINYVEVLFWAADHPYWGDLRVTLTSPAGTSSLLAQERYVSNSGTYSGWAFGSVQQYGESSRGTWTLNVADLQSEDVGKFQRWTLRVYGTTNRAGATVPSTSASLPRTALYTVNWGPLRSTPTVTSYDVRYRRSAEVWRAWKANTTTRQGVLSGLPGSTYHISVRPRDASGPVGDYSSPQRLVVPADDGSAKYYGRWSVRRASAYYQGRECATSRYHDYLEYRFRGSRIGVVATMGPRRAPAAVYIDGRQVGTIYTAASKVLYRRLTRVFSIANPRALHTIRLMHATRITPRVLEIDGFYVQQ